MATKKRSPAIATLESALVKNPRDLATCAVYADHLQENGDPLGAALALHVAILGEESSAERQTELKIVLKTTLESSELWGSLAADVRHKELELVYYLAILERIRARPREHKSQTPSADLLRTVLELPVARLVSRLTVPRYAFDAFTTMLPDLVAAGHLRHVRALVIESAIDRGVRKRDRSDGALAALSCLGPTLEYLDLTGLVYGINAKKLSLPNLITLRIAEIEEKRDLQPFIAALPRLERVAVATTRFEPLAKFGAFASMKSLRILRLDGGAHPELLSVIAHLRKALPAVTTFEINDVTRKTIAAIRESHPDLTITPRIAIQLD